VYVAHKLPCGYYLKDGEIPQQWKKYVNTIEIYGGEQTDCRKGTSSLSTTCNIYVTALGRLTSVCGITVCS
jgi:hypothetical protein